MNFQRIALPALLAFLLSNSHQAMAEELDMTMQVLEPGEQPETIIQRIQLPKPETVTVKDIVPEVPAERALDKTIDDIETLQDTSTEAVTDTSKDINDGNISLPKAAEKPVEATQEAVEDADTRVNENTDTINDKTRQALPDPEQTMDELYHQETDHLSPEQALEQLDTDMPSNDSLMEEPLIDTHEQMIDELPVEDIPEDNVQETIDILP